MFYKNNFLYISLIAILLLSSKNILAATSSVVFENTDYFELNVGTKVSNALKIYLKSDSNNSRLWVDIYTLDGDWVTRIKANPVEKDSTRFLAIWTGVDSADNLLPSEAYVPVIIEDSDGQKNDNDSVLYDPREFSGGEQVDITNVQADKETGLITYKLPEASRVLIRAGINNGPLMNTITAWKARPKGTNRQVWDGMDSEKVVDLLKNKDLRILVMGYALPKPSILINNTGATDYQAYRKMRGWKDRDPNMAQKIKLEKDGKRVSRFYYFPIKQKHEPKIIVSIEDSNGTALQNKPSINEPVNIKVDLAKDSLWLMQQTQFEVAFFIDYQFVAEEESGYTPLTWRWNPAGLSPGEHVLTVNLSGFVGHVGVYNILFTVPEK